MTWIPRDVKDQNVQYPNKYKIDGVSANIEPDFGTVIEAGTDINKAYLQPIEDELEITYSTPVTSTASVPENTVDGKMLYIAEGLTTESGGVLVHCNLDIESTSEDKSSTLSGYELKSVPNGTKDYVANAELVEGVLVPISPVHVEKISEELTITGTKIVSIASTYKQTSTVVLDIILDLLYSTVPNAFNNDNAFVIVKGIKFAPQSGVGVADVKWNTPNQYWMTSTDKRLRLSLADTDTGWSSTPTLTQVRDYLTANPMTLVYEILTPIITPITNELFAFSKGAVYNNSTGTLKFGTCVNLASQSQSTTEVAIFNNKTLFNLLSTLSDTIRDTALTGLSLVTGTAITATDTILVALGKLQKQITDLGTSKLNTADLLTKILDVDGGTSGINVQYLNGAEKDTDGTLGGNSDSSIPTEKAVKTYVDNNINTLQAGNLKIWDSKTAIAQTANTTYTKFSTFAVRSLAKGTLRVSFKLKNQAEGVGVSYGKIYVNDIAIGTERSNSTEKLTTFTEDISVNAGDEIAIYIKHDTGASQAILYPFWVSVAKTPTVLVDTALYV